MTDTPRSMRRHRITWLPSSIFDTFQLPAAPPYTQLLTVGCADDFYAVRVGLANITRGAWRADRLIARPSTTWNDLANPTGDAEWVPLTFAHQGTDSATIASGPGLPTGLTVSGNQIDPGTGLTTNPAWTWTDWSPIRSLPRADAPDGHRVLMFRMLVPQGQMITYARGVYGAYAGDTALHGGFEHATGKFDGDIVTNPVPVDPEKTFRGQGINSIVCVQYLTRNPGVTFMVTGDSHQIGTSTLTQFSSAVLYGVVAAGVPLVGRFPLGYVNCATGGATSAQYFARPRDLLPSVKPGVVILPGWTANDLPFATLDTDAVGDRFIAHLLLAAESCDDHGAVPIFLTPFPHDRTFMTDERTRSWNLLRETVMGFRANGRIVLDAATILGEQTGGALDGIYKPELTDDNVHPNDSGHRALATALTPLMAAVADLR